jgi:ankyrin repeat protein
MNIILRDERRVTALRHVDAEEYQAIVKLFIQRGANVDAEGGEMTAPDVDPKITIDTKAPRVARNARQGKARENAEWTE